MDVLRSKWYYISCLYTYKFSYSLLLFFKKMLIGKSKKRAKKIIVHFLKAFKKPKTISIKFIKVIAKSNRYMLTPYINFTFSVVTIQARWRVRYNARESEISEITNFWNKSVAKLKATKPEEFQKLILVPARYVQKTIDAFLISKCVKFHIDMKKYLDTIKVKLLSYSSFPYHLLLLIIYNSRA